MLTVFIDPTVADVLQLNHAVSFLRKQAPCNVVCFFNTHQQVFFQKNGINVINYSSTEWPIQERNTLMEGIHQAFNNQLFKPWSILSISAGRKRYTLSVMRFISGNRFLKDVYLPIAKTYLIYSKSHELNKVVIVGGANFKNQIEFCLQTAGRSIEVEFVNPGVDKVNHKVVYRKYVLAFLSLGRLSKWMVSRIFLGKRAMIIPTGNMTDPVIKLVKNHFMVIHTIGHMITLFRFLGIGHRLDTIATRDKILDVLKKEKHNQDTSTQLALDLFLDHLKKGALESKIMDTFAAIKILDFIKPKTIVQYNLIGEHYPMLMWAAANGVATVCIQHGIQGKFGFEVKHDIESEYYYPWANLPIDQVRNEKVIIRPYGNPCYTPIAEDSPIASGRIKKVLIAPTGLPYYKADVDAEFWIGMIIFLKNRKLDPVIKFHHKDRFKNMVIKDFEDQGIKFAVSTMSIKEAVKACDLVITTVSTVALDAFEFDRPVIVINNAWESEYFSRYGVAVVLENTAGLQEEIERLSADENYYRDRIMSQRKFYNRFSSRSTTSKIADELVELGSR